MNDKQIKEWCLHHVCRSCQYNEDGKCKVKEENSKKGKRQMKLIDILRLFPVNQLVSLADENYSQLPYGNREKISDLNDMYNDKEVISIRVLADVLYIAIKA